MEKVVIDVTRNELARLHMAARDHRKDSHAKRVEVDGKYHYVSLITINGCSRCHKSLFEIMEGKKGEYCHIHTALKRAVQD